MIGKEGGFGKLGGGDDFGYIFGLLFVVISALSGFIFFSWFADFVLG